MAAHNELGKWGEDIAACYLAAKNYAIIARDWRHGHRDLDIIASYEGWLVIVEVKTRARNWLVSPEEAVDSRKMRSLCIAANAYIKINRVNAPVRFDIIAVTGDTGGYDINHIENAFVPPVSRRW